MNTDNFERCPNCQNKASLFSRHFIFRCPKCYRMFCDTCWKGNGFWGYRCPHCSYRLKGHWVADLAEGYY